MPHKTFEQLATAPETPVQEPVVWRELCRRLYVELLYCDQQMTSMRDDDGNLMFWAGKTISDVLIDAKQALDTSPAAQPEHEVVTIDGDAFTVPERVAREMQHLNRLVAHLDRKISTPPAAQPAPDLLKLKPENAQQMRDWIADGSFLQRAIDTMFELSQEITNLKVAQPEVPVVPEGWKLVPVEPTATMKSAGISVETHQDSHFEVPDLTWEEVTAIYKAMLAAAAQPAVPNKELGHFVQPHWGHVGQAFIDGAREARVNPSATDDDVNRAADGYTKRLFEELDPESEQLLRANAYPQSNRPVKG